MSEAKELKRCSGCKSTMLLEYFKINRKGEYNKTCIQCAERRKKFQCEQCDYRCPKQSRLDRHIKAVHDKIKDFECKQCGFKFSCNSNLKQHIKQVHKKSKILNALTKNVIGNFR